MKAKIDYTKLNKLQREELLKDAPVYAVDSLSKLVGDRDLFFWNEKSKRYEGNVPFEGPGDTLISFCASIGVEDYVGIDKVGRDLRRIKHINWKKINPDLVFADGTTLRRDDFTYSETVDDLIEKLREPNSSRPNLLRRAKFSLTGDWNGGTGAWEKFISQLSPEDQKQLQKLSGALLAKRAHDQHIAVLNGPGAITYMEMIAEILMSDHVDLYGGFSNRTIAREQLTGNYLQWVDNQPLKTIKRVFESLQYQKGLDVLGRQDMRGFTLHVTSEGHNQIGEPIWDRVHHFDFPLLPEDMDEIMNEDGESVLRWLLQGAIDAHSYIEYQYPAEYVDSVHTCKDGTEHVLEASWEVRARHGRIYRDVHGL